MNIYAQLTVTDFSASPFLLHKITSHVLLSPGHKPKTVAHGKSKGWVENLWDISHMSRLRAAGLGRHHHRAKLYLCTNNGAGFDRPNNSGSTRVAVDATGATAVCWNILAAYAGGKK